MGGLGVVVFFLKKIKALKHHYTVAMTGQTPPLNSRHSFFKKGLQGLLSWRYKKKGLSPQRKKIRDLVKKKSWVFK